MVNFKTNKMKMNKITTLPLLALTLVLGITSCKKEEVEPTPTTPSMMSMTYDYGFNNGQVVSSEYYDGMHADNLTATMMVEEISSTQTEITVTLNNTISGETYHIHAHDAADPATTPNGTPYNESANTEVFTQMLTGNGGSVSVSQTVDMTYAQITETYEGFLVVHDPLQAINTAEISTYIVVGSFARAQAASNLSSMEYTYNFNTGQIDPSYAYSGMHANTLMGMLKIQELGSGESRVSVNLMNTMNGETYHVHAHDSADPATTPNGTPYNETPNSGLLTVMMNGTGGNAMASQISAMSYNDITMNYSGFFVAHDPLQAINTADPSTYVLLGVFAQ